MEEMVFMAVINFKVLPAASAAASAAAAAAAANSIYNCHMMAMNSPETPTEWKSVCTSYGQTDQLTD